MSAFNNNNPFLVPVAEYERYGGLPPFELLKTEHYKQAFEVGMSTHLEELKAIATSPDAPTFENTFVAFDKAGSLLLRVGKVFHNLCSSHCPPDLQSVQTEMAPLLAAHRSATFMFPGLFDRIDKVHEGRHGASAPQYSPEQMRLIERIHLDFVRAGARFDAAAQARYKTIMTDLAGLTTKFSQHILGDESTFTIDLTEADLSGLPSFLVQAAKQAAVERSKPEGTYVITLSRSSVEPFLTFSDRRDLREKAWRAWTCRGELDPSRDCRQLAVEILAKRAEQASMHG
jgi:peptidyl-dipeptidase Dcp